MSTVQDRISLLEKRKLIAIKKHGGTGKYKNNSCRNVTIQTNSQCLLAPGKTLGERENSEHQKKPLFGFSENSPVWVKSGSNEVLGAVLTQTAGESIWVRSELYSIKTAVFATYTLQKRLFSMVGVSGFEPEASWTRTKRDTKLRHTPMNG